MDIKNVSDVGSMALQTPTTEAVGSASDSGDVTVDFSEMMQQLATITLMMNQIARMLKAKQQGAGIELTLKAFEDKLAVAKKEMEVSKNQAIAGGVGALIGAIGAGVGAGHLGTSLGQLATEGGKYFFVTGQTYDASEMKAKLEFLQQSVEQLLKDAASATDKSGELSRQMKDILAKMVEILNAIRSAAMKQN